MHKIRRIGRSILLPLLVLSAAAPTTGAAIVVYTDRPAWLEALGRPVEYSENFNGAATDRSFRNSSVQLAEFSLRQTGTGEFRNLVDVEPFVYPDNNGTPNASLFVDADGPISVILEFARPAIAFGADFTATAGNERVNVRLTGADDPTFDLPGENNADTNFFGFIATEGDRVLGLEFIPASRDGVLGYGEGFGMDDVAGVSNAPAAVTVPEPDSLLLASLMLGLLPLASARPLTRRRFA